MKNEKVMQIRIEKIKNQQGKIYYKITTTADDQKLAGWVELPNGIIPPLSSDERPFFRGTLYKELSLFIESYVRDRPEITGYKTVFNKENYLAGSIRRTENHQSWQDRRVEI